MTDDLRTYLLSQSAVTDLVSTRVYPVWLPQDAVYPCLTVHRVSENHGHHYDSANGLATTRFQLDCWGTSYATVHGLAEVLRGELSGFKGTMGSTTVHYVELDNLQDVAEKPTDGGEPDVYHVALDVLVTRQESVPSF